MHSRSTFTAAIAAAKLNRKGGLHQIYTSQPTSLGMETLSPLAKQKTLDTLSAITTSARQLGIDPSVACVAILAVSLATVSTLMVILYYLRIFILLGLVLFGGKAFLMFSNKEVRRLMGASEEEKARLEAQPKESIEGLEELQDELLENLKGQMEMEG